MAPTPAADQDLVARSGAFHPIAEVIPKPMSPNDDLFVVGKSGAEGARTPDLRHAMAALSQLSYSPREQISLRPVYSRPLGALRVAQAKLNRRASINYLNRQEIDLVELVAIESHAIHVIRRVGGSNRPSAGLSEADYRFQHLDP
jgi:hypothetical protein